MRKKNLMAYIGTLAILAGASSAQAAANLASLQAAAPVEDIQVLKQNSGNLSIPAKLLSRNFRLTKYEMLVISELLRQQAAKEASGKDALADIVELQKKYQEEYKEIFGKVPGQDKLPSSEASPVQQNTAGLPAQQSAENPAQQPELPSQAAKLPEPESSADIMTPDEVSDLAASVGIEAPADVVIEKPQAIRNRIMASETPEELVENSSLINIRSEPQRSRREDLDNYEYANQLNPITDLNSEKIPFAPVSADTLSGENQEDDFEKESLKALIDAAASAEEKKAKHFFLTVAHSLYYVDEKGEGNVPLDTSVTNDNGEYYEPVVTNQYQLEEVLEIGLGIRVHKAVDLVMSLVAKNEDGILGGDGSKWEFGNVLFKFHPERIGKDGLKKLDSEGVVIKENGRIIGKRIGHGTSITTNTETGATGLDIGKSRAAYSPDDGFSFTHDDSRYYLGFGNLSIDFSSYTLQLSDCKAVEVGYHDNNESLVLLYGKPNNAEEGENNKPGKYSKNIFGAQYTTKKLIDGMTLSFNFATAKSTGHLNNPNGAKKSRDTVYSIFFKSGEESKNTSFEGEIAHSINYYDLDSDKSRRTGNADYFDLTHRFSDKLSGTLHLINIDDTFDASSLVEDKTGDNLLTTNDGDGEPDYLYATGQRGLDLALSYNLSDSAALAFGYSRYTKTEDKNSKTNFYLSGSKQWSLSDKNGETNGTVSLQQRFEYNDVSNKKYVNKTSDTTLSYSGEPWKDGEVAADVQRIIDKADGNESRIGITVAHHFYPLNRVSITPKIEYTRKKGSPGIEEKNPIDATTLINSLTVSYEMVPDELVVNLLVSKEKYDILSSEIDKSTGGSVDGESRNVFGTGIGLVWEPKKIKGLSLGISYRKDKVEYLNRHDVSHQDVWEYTLEYSHPISDKIRASISYDYKSARDRAKPIYDEVTRTASVDIDAQIGKHSSIQLSHSYTSTYKPLDPSSNSKTRSTVLQMVNRW